VLETDPYDGTAEVLSRGHGKVQGIAVDDEGRIWTAEHGRRGGDELSFLPGENHGWPEVTLGAN
jgi:glucose/arabinose dehydrogenase